MSTTRKTFKSLTIVIVSLQVLVDVNAGTAHFQVDAKLEQTLVFTHQLRQTHLGLDAKHLRPLSIKCVITVGDFNKSIKDSSSDETLVRDLICINF